jgi:4'-phosphopantetheinyl transferase
METPPILSAWSDPPAAVSLVPGDLHVWCAPLDLRPVAVEELLSLLTDDERRRAARFGTERLRDRYVAGRGRLRAILARYLGVEPSELEFQYQDRGKPMLATAWQPAGLHFNLSHSQGLALFAVAVREVGIDVERVRPVANMARLVQRYFGTDEQDEWNHLPAEVQPAAFFCGWTRKEAWLKAVGSGLSYPLDQVQVSLTPGTPARFLAIQGDPREAAAWWLDSFEPAAGYVAAVTLCGQPDHIRRWRWEA